MKLGDMGKKIHSGRSRNDQVLVDLKLFTRHELKEIVDAVIHDMTMWIVRVVMPYDNELGIVDTHHLHVFKGYLSHEIIRQTWLVIGLETECNVSHRLLNPWI